VDASNCPLLLAVLLVAASCHDPTPNEIAGTFTRHTSSLDETLTVRTNHTYTHVVRYFDGASFAVTNQWTNKHVCVSCEWLYTTLDIATMKTLNPRELGPMVYLSYGADTLVKDVDSGFVFRRTPGAGNR
jgi:hypothetical protein